MKLSAPIYQLKRRAKLLARDEKLLLHTALDRVANQEGFASWSLLSARSAARARPGALLEKLSPGDMLLLGARPGQGKTLLGLDLLLDAVREGRQGVFFTLEWSERQSRERLRSRAGDKPALADAAEVVASDAIDAELIVRHLAHAARGTIAVVDYLQILDQQRSKPDLSEQISILQSFARERGVIFAFISQIDRAYDPEAKPLPDVQDIRLPNKVDMGLFSKACFLHQGKTQFQTMG